MDESTPKNSSQAAKNLMNTLGYLENIEHSEIVKLEEKKRKSFSRNLNFLSLTQQRTMPGKLRKGRPISSYGITKKLSSQLINPIHKPQKIIPEYVELQPKLFMPSDSNIYDGPVKSVQSSSAIPLKIITRKNRVQSIHPLYRPQ